MKLCHHCPKYCTTYIVSAFSVLPNGFQIWFVSTHVYLYFTVVLICTSQIIKETGHPLIYFHTSHIS